MIIIGRIIKTKDMYEVLKIVETMTGQRDRFSDPQC